MRRRDWIKQSLVTPALAISSKAASREAEEQPRKPSSIAGGKLEWTNSQVRLRLRGSADALWTFTAGSREIAIAPPLIAIDGILRRAILTSFERTGPEQRLSSTVTEQRFSGRFVDDPSLSLELVFRLARDSPVVRFRYVLHARPDAKLTGDGTLLSYLSLSLADMNRSLEIQISVFNEMLHSYTVAELPITPRAFEDEVALVGPIIAGSDERNRAFLVAYEHGAQVPDSFLKFHLDRKQNVNLRAAKTNYVPGQAAEGFSTVWMQAAGSDAGLDTLALQYRQFILSGLSLHEESRQPYIFYNTWNYQERNKWFNGKPYLQSMTPERISAEVDVAHRMGIDVFVMDTGWYERTGDWEVSKTRFPNALTDIKSRLDRYGMKLGLWFNPTAAARSSAMLAGNRTSVRTVGGKEGDPHPIWETEESYPMCLVSQYSDAFAETLIRVARKTGARYFKWDAIQQYGCDSPHHWHGTASNTQAERWNSYAFQLPQQMARVADKVAAAIPDIIIDFDITEGGRAVGLCFLSAGKYFLINNGPYLFNYDLPLDRERQNWNLFFYPGPARTWICRSPLTYDRWIPSILFLTHYLPDDPASSQLVNVASLILGQNGVWGDLPKVSPEGVEQIGNILRRYKAVRNDITLSYPVMTGDVGSSPEIHEKILTRTGKGVVALFATAKGSYRYVTENTPHRQPWATGGVKVQFDTKGHAMIEADFAAPGAAIVFFGAEEIPFGSND